MAREFFLQWEHRGTRWETPRDREVGHRETRDEETRGGGGEVRKHRWRQMDRWRVIVWECWREKEEKTGGKRWRRSVCDNEWRWRVEIERESQARREDLIGYCCVVSSCLYLESIGGEVRLQSEQRNGPLGPIRQLVSRVETNTPSATKETCFYLPLPAHKFS